MPCWFDQVCTRSPCAGGGMRSPVTLVRNLSLFFKNLQERSVQHWNSERSRRARDWVATRLKEANSQIRAARLARPGAFWAVLLGSIPLLIVSALFTTGNADRAWPPLATFATAVGATIVAIATLMRHFAQTEADRQRRIVETFSKAVEQLGSDKLEVRVGGIFALERLSKESPDDYWTIMEVLAAFVRDRMRYTTMMDRLHDRAYFLWLRAGRPEGRSDEFWAAAERLEETPTDIDAIFTVIKRRSAENRQREEDSKWRFDLSGTYLREAQLDGVYLEGAALFNAHLEMANLIEAHLEGALLLGAHVERASLSEAHLEGAALARSHLEGTRFVEAHLEGAVLTYVHLEGANLSGAHLEGADLRGAVGLTDDQLLDASGDASTLLPEDITRPKHWPALTAPVL
jgi:hypothetical protein